ncbi:hypothetical protein BDY19DRAFT_955414 [Irpex rosettiformis]|uniref:Uncharacterized protein n=1 Tax=Irpex rosettiformis TaxID=378272 RepID=A0ACB8TZD8_9APHY|nr:hypothetical protein BDY19DRAFT_955414 [Irpex rosettiformis]
MSSLRFASLVLSSSSRCRASTLRDTVRPSLYALARDFQHSAVNHRTVSKVQTKPPTNDEETLKALDALQALAHKTNIDVWNQPIDTLDLIIPSWHSKRSQASIVDHCKAFFQSQLNWMRNAQSMFLIAKENAFPGIQVKSRWSPQIFRAKKGPWMDGIGREASEAYTVVNKAVAAGDIKTLRKHTSDSYKDTILKRVQARDKNHLHIWKLHGQNAPPQVLSIRSFVGHMGIKDPLQGHRLVIQALVKFDTNQSLQVFNCRGKVIGGSDEPKRVVEYLVLQKRGWVPGPWIIRDQLYESLDTKLIRIQ